MEAFWIQYLSLRAPSIAILQDPRGFSAIQSPTANIPNRETPNRQIEGVLLVINISNTDGQTVDSVEPHEQRKLLNIFL